MKHFNKAQPFNDLPPLPPKAELETKEILTKTIRASRALTQLNGALRNLPNPSLFLDTLHLQEAKASSEIENIITTNDDLYRALVADMKFDILIQAPPKFLNPLRPDLLQLVGKLLARYFDVAHE
jgi:Fic family protein